MPTPNTLLNATPARNIRRTAPPSGSTANKAQKNTTSTQGAALAQALAAAAWVTHHVSGGQSLTQALAQTNLLLPPSASLRGAAQDLSYHTQRHLGRADALLSSLSKKPLQHMDAGILALLRVSVALLCDHAGDTQRYDAHTVVDQAVRAVPAVLASRMVSAAAPMSGHNNPRQPQLTVTAPSSPNTQVVAGFVNGVLRTYLREQATRDAAAMQTVSGEWNHPAWWVTRLQADYPRDWRALLHSNNQKPVMTLRANARMPQVANAALAQAYLAEHGIAASTVPDCPNALTLAQPLPVTQIPQFDAGWFSVQDAAAQRCLDLLQLANGQRVLDACAAPGGKTAHILERYDVALTALDISSDRLGKVRQTLDRITPTLPAAATEQLQLKAADATDTHSWWDSPSFDRILLDAPCSASGVVRRHPDSRWLRRDSDIAALMHTQALLLDKLWQTLAPGGLLLYVTCSVFKCEGEQQIAAFVARTRSAQALPCLGHVLPIVDQVTQNRALSKVTHARATPAVQRAGNTAQSKDTKPQDIARQMLNTLAASPSLNHDGFYYALLHKLV